MTLAEREEELTLWRERRKELLGVSELAKGRGGSEFHAKYSLNHINENITQLENEIAIMKLNAVTRGGC